MNNDDEPKPAPLVVLQTHPAALFHQELPEPTALVIASITERAVGSFLRALHEQGYQVVRAEPTPAATQPVLPTAFEYCTVSIQQGYIRVEGAVNFESRGAGEASLADAMNRLAGMGFRHTGEMATGMATKVIMERAKTL